MTSSRNVGKLFSRQSVQEVLSTLEEEYTQNRIECNVYSFNLQYKNAYCFILMRLGSEINFKRIWDHSLSTFAKFSEELSISFPLIRTRMCACQGIRNVRFSKRSLRTY